MSGASARRTVSRRRAAGSRRNKRLKFVGSFSSDSRPVTANRKRRPMKPTPLRHDYEGGIVMTQGQTQDTLFGKAMDSLLNLVKGDKPERRTYGSEELHAMSVRELKAIVKELNPLQPYSKLRKDELVDLILEVQ